MKCDENALIEKIKRSDVLAFKKIFSQYYPILFKLVYYKIKESNLTEDIVQETFIKIWEHRHTLKPDLSFLAYISKISNNLIKDHFKKIHVRRKYKDQLSKTAVITEPSPEEMFNVSQLRKEILEIIHQDLPEKCRTIFVLSRIEGKTNRQIAEFLNISKKTVENQLTHALKILRKKLANFL